MLCRRTPFHAGVERAEIAESAQGARPLGRCGAAVWGVGEVTRLASEFIGNQWRPLQALPATHITLNSTLLLLTLLLPSAGYSTVSEATYMCAGVRM